MKTIKLIGVFLILSFRLFSQGMNNHFDYDATDFNMIFKELEINTFKFPIKQCSNQILDIVLEEYENKKLINRISVIDDLKYRFEQLGLQNVINAYFKPPKDSVYFYRFYFYKKDSVMKIRIKAQGVESVKEFNFKGKSTYDVNANTSDDIKNQYIEIKNEPKMLLYLYANAAGNDNFLECSTGLSKERLIDSYYYLIFISVEPYQDE